MKYWQVAARKLTLSGLRVLLYLRMTENKSEWHEAAFISWMGMSYTGGKNAWQRGVSDIVENGFAVYENGILKLVNIMK